MNSSLHLGDCLEVLKTIPDCSIDSIINDPPFSTTQCGWDSPLDWEQVWKEFRRIVKPHAPIVLFAAQPFTTVLISSCMPHYKCIWSWEKEKGTNFFKTAQQPLRVIEDICVFAFENSYTYNPQMVSLDKPYRHTLPLRHSAITGRGIIKKTAEREYRDYTHAHPKNLLKFARDNANRGKVPTQKPLTLMEYLVATYSRAGDVVLDPTMGSGTTCVAAKKLGRDYIGIERDPDHFAYAEKRINETTIKGDDLIVF